MHTKVVGWLWGFSCALLLVCMYVNVDAAHAETLSRAQTLIKDRYLVTLKKSAVDKSFSKLRKNLSKDSKKLLSKREVIESLEGQIRDKKNVRLIKKLENLNVQVVKVEKKNLKDLDDLKEYFEVEPDRLMQPLAAPNDPAFLYQWWLKGGNGLDMANYWNAHTGSTTNTVVAVIDTGIELSHPDLVNNLWKNSIELNGQPGFDDDGNGYIDDVYGYNIVEALPDPLDYDDPYSHGTHVAGIIGAQGNNSRGVSGVNWRTQLMSLKVCLDRECPVSSMIEALNYAIQAKIAGAPVKVANISIGGIGALPFAFGQTILLAEEHGIFVVLAAGNDSVNIDTTAYSPGGAPGAFTVAALKSNGTLASFSNYGSKVDIAAPGDAIYSTIYQRDGSYGYLSGTSMAAPAVSGLAALISSRYPLLTPREIGQHIRTTGKTLIGLSGKVASGATAYGSTAAPINLVSISGAVRNQNGVGLPGVKLYLNSTSSLPRGVTDKNGQFTIGVPYGTSGQIFAVLPTYAMTPSSKTFTTITTAQTNFNFTGTTSQKFSISGRIYSSGVQSAVSNITIKNNGVVVASTDSNGDYTFEVDAYTNNFIVPEKTGLLFEPSSRVIHGIYHVHFDEFFQSSARPGYNYVYGEITNLEGTESIESAEVLVNGNLTATSNYSGFYGFVAPQNTNITVSYRKTGLTFNPATRTVNPNEEFTEIPVTRAYPTGSTYQVSGSVTDGVNGLASVTIKNNGSNVATTNSSGQYSFNVAGNSAISVTAERSGYAFSPATQTRASVTSNVTLSTFVGSNATKRISGRITFNGNGLGNVNIKNNGQSITETNANGDYSLNVTVGSNNIIQPVLSGYVFSPTDATANSISADQVFNFTATAPTYTVSGRVTASGNGLSGVFINNNGSQVATTNSTGYYSFQAARNSSIQVTAVKTGYTFSPNVILNYDVTAPVTNADFVGTLVNYTVSGRVVYNGTGLSGVAIMVNGFSVSNTDEFGNFSFPAGAGSSFNVTPQKIGYIFNPVFQTVSAISGPLTLPTYTAQRQQYTISGRVLENGVGIGGAQIRNGGIPVGNSGAGGQYSFLADVGSYVSVTVLHIGFTSNTTHTINSLNANTTLPDITITRNQYTVQGSVTSGGVGLSGVAIKNEGITLATTAGNGSYSFSAPYESSYVLTPEKLGYAFTPTNRYVPPVSATVNVAAFTAVQSSFQISGRVVLSGTGFSGVTVKNNGNFAATTDGNGNFSFSVPVNSNSTITYEKAGYSFNPTSQTANAISQNVTLPTVTGSAIQYTISGYVIYDGAALSGVTVKNNNSVVATTNASGAYSFSVSYGSSNTVTYEKSGFSFTPSSQVVSPVTSDYPLSIVNGILNTYSITGTVLLNGTGLSGATIKNNGQAITSTTSTGAFSLTVNALTSNSITVEKAGYTFSPSAQQVNSITSNTTLSNFVATLGSRTISGIVVSNGTGLSGVTVKNNNSVVATTSSTGAYNFTVSYGSSIAVTFEKLGYTFSPSSHSIASVTADAVIPNITGSLRTYIISGTVVHNGTGLGGVIVKRNGDAILTTTSSGAFSLSVDALTNNTITVEKAGYTFSPSAQQVNTISTDTTLSNFVGTLGSHTISGLVLSNGTGLSGVTVRNNNSVVGTTSASGAFSFSVAHGSDNTISYEKTGYTFNPATQLAASVSGAVQLPNVTASLRTYLISGTVVHNGTGLGGVIVKRNGDAIVTTTSSGAFSLSVDALTNNSITVEKAGYTFSPSAQQVNTIATDTTLSNFVGTLGSHTISGVVLSNGAGLSGVTVKNNNSVVGTTSSTGAYSFTVSYGSSSLVTFEKVGYTFSPSSHSIASVTADAVIPNITGSLRTYIISGTVVHNGTGLGGVVVKRNGDAIVTTTSSGAFSISVDALTNNSITVEKAGYTFSPSAQQVNAIATDTTLSNFVGTLGSYTISGLVLSNGAGLSGVTVKNNNSVVGTTTASGAFSFAVAHGSNNTITLEKAHYTFSPVSQVVNGISGNSVLGNFTASPVSYTLSGQVLSNGSGLSGVIVKSNGNPVATTTSTGAYSFLAPSGADLSLTFEKSGYSFTPTSLAVTNLTANTTLATVSANLNAYTVTGIVTHNGVGLSGVTVKSNGSVVATSSTEGAYSFALTSGTTTNVTFEKLGFTFSPASQSITSISANRTLNPVVATAITYTISGAVTLNASGLSGVDIYNNDVLVTSTGSSGVYSFQVGYGTNNVVRPSKSGYSFSPTSQLAQNVTSNRALTTFAAQAVSSNVTISGTVISNGVGLSGVLIRNNGIAVNYSGSLGRFSISVPVGSNNRITVERVGLTFTPSFREALAISSSIDIGQFVANQSAYIVSGRVVSNGSGLAQATVRNNGLTVASTDASGNFSFSVQARSTAVVSIQKSGFTFTPSSLTAQNVSSNVNIGVFSAVAAQVAVSGTVKYDGVGLSGVTIYRGSNIFATSNASGFFSGNVNVGDSISLKAEKESYSFTPETFTAVVGVNGISNISFIASKEESSRLESPAFSKYNTFLSAFNFLELMLTGPKNMVVKISVFSIRGELIKSVNILLEPFKQRDIDINALVGLLNTYGIVKLEFDYPDALSKLVGRMSTYRLNPSSDTYSFAFSRELENLSKGQTFATANSIDPSGKGQLTANWAEIINPNDTEMKFLVSYYGQNGSVVAREPVTVPARAESDIQAGHEFGQGVYTIEFTALDATKGYLAYVTRYSEKASASEPFRFAFPVPARAGAEGVQLLPISNALGQCYSRMNWIEVTNVTSSPVTATLKFRSDTGEILTNEVSKVGAFEQKHFFAGDRIPLGQSGWLEIDGNKDNALITQGLTYFNGCKDGDLQTAYVSLARDPKETDLFGSYNRFLGLRNHFSLATLVGNEIDAEIDVLGFDGSSLGAFNFSTEEEQSTAFRLPLDSVTDANTYGLLYLKNNTKSPLVAESVRIREVQGKVDFAISIPLR